MKKVAVFSAVLVLLSVAALGIHGSTADARPLAELIKAARLDYVHPDVVEENLLAHSQAKKVAAFKLFSFPGRDVVETEEILSTMKKEGFGAASLRELLVYYKANQRSVQASQMSIAALGSPLLRRGFAARYVPVIWNVGGALALYPFFLDGGWSGDYYFLGVRTEEPRLASSR